MALSFIPIQADELSLLVYVIDCAHVAPGNLITAEHAMTQAFGTANVRARWRDAATSPPPSGEPNQVTVVILSPEMTEQKAARDHVAPTALATAAAPARRAWVFIGRVEDAAQAQHVSIGAALGTVIAHEVAHIAADMPHAPRGIMGRELRLNSNAFEGFSADEGQRLHTAMRASADGVALQSAAAGAANDPRAADTHGAARDGQPRHPLAANEHAEQQ
jgi:hypothetical protein